MKFDPTHMSVKILFRTFPTFNIPIFQRDYSWDKPFYSRFLDDIIKSIYFDKEGMLKCDYFIGVMVFSGDTKSDTIDVVDG